MAVEVAGVPRTRVETGVPQPPFADDERILGPQLWRELRQSAMLFGLALVGTAGLAGLLDVALRVVG